MTRFQPGQSGNPRGRPAGAKNKLSEAFLEALHLDFEAHGIETIQRVREQKPDQYLKVVASLVPRDLNLAVEDPVTDWTDDELADVIERLNEEIMGARVGEGGLAN